MNAKQAVMSIAQPPAANILGYGEYVVIVVSQVMETSG